MLPPRGELTKEGSPPNDGRIDVFGNSGEAEGEEGGDAGANPNLRNPLLGIKQLNKYPKYRIIMRNPKVLKFRFRETEFQAKTTA